MDVQAGGVDIAVTGQRLGYLEFAGGAQDDGDKIVPEEMGGDGAGRGGTQGFFYPCFDDIPPGLGAEWLELVIATCGAAPVALPFYTPGSWRRKSGKEPSGLRAELSNAALALFPKQ